MGQSSRRQVVNRRSESRPVPLSQGSNNCQFNMASYVSSVQQLQISNAQVPTKKDASIASAQCFLLTCRFSSSLVLVATGPSRDDGTAMSHYATRNSNTIPGEGVASRPNEERMIPDGGSASCHQNVPPCVLCRPGNGCCICWEVWLRLQGSGRHSTIHFSDIMKRISGWAAFFSSASSLRGWSRKNASLPATLWHPEARCASPHD